MKRIISAVVVLSGLAAPAAANKVSLLGGGPFLLRQLLVKGVQ